MSIYLSNFVRHIRKHVKDSIPFTPSPQLSDKEAKLLAERRSPLAQSVPIFVETQAWLKRYYVFVRDAGVYMYYNIQTGLWDKDVDNTRLFNLLNDYFTILSEEALKVQDLVMLYYAKELFKVTKLRDLVTKIQKSAYFTIESMHKLVEQTENYVYFDTVEGTNALLDLSQDKWNLRLVKLEDTQDLYLTKRQTQKLSVNPDDEPKLFLSLIEEYMCHDKDLIEYFHKVLAYLMSPHNYNQVFFHFYGPKGKNGKSTLVKVIQDILGPRTVRLPNEYLLERPPMSFKREDVTAAMDGKSLYIFNEMKSRAYLDDQIFKKISDGGVDDFGNKVYEIVRPAYSKAYGVSIQGTSIVLSNGLLQFPTGADIDPILRRMIIIPFNYLIKREDPSITNRLAAEYPQIQLWLYMNYFKYRNINLKDELKPQVVQEVMDRYAEEVDMLQNFFKDCFVFSADDTKRLLRSDLYRTYEQYCDANGRIPIGNNGSNGFQASSKPYLENLLGAREDQYLMLLNGVYYIKGIEHSPYYLKEILPFAKR